MNDALTQIVTRPGRAATPQHEQADPRQVPDSAGGWTFQVAGEARILRFLTIGTEGGTYYASERALTKDNAAVVLDWARERPAQLAELAAQVSQAGRAPRNNAAIFAVVAAMSLGNTTEGRQAAAAQFGQVVRTGTHLFTAAGYLQQFRGWGRGARRAFASWYTTRDAEALAYQLIKYRQRNDWTHRDVLRSAHSTRVLDGTAQGAVLDWLCGRDPRGEVPGLIGAYERAREIERSTDSPGPRGTKTAAYVRLVRDHPGLPWEALPDEAVAQGEVWRALIENGLPVTALLRQLPRLTRLGVLAPMSEHLAMVTGRLTDTEVLRRGRVHPAAILIAAKTYAAGRSEKGSSTWTPVPQVSAALNDAFYAAFGAVEPSGKRTMIALDVSGSMSSPTAGYNLACSEVTAAMSLVVMKTEPSWGVYGFNQGIKPLNLSPHMALEDVARRVAGLTYGGTDCALPMLWAAQNRVEVDTFQVWTDNETWAGSVHPHEALAAYRQQMGIGARQQVIAITPTDFTIAVPDDPGTLDVSGFDAAVARLLADHARGDV
jgi:60 kDa SS-A/Ro ribonucleoprotein